MYVFLFNGIMMTVCGARWVPETVRGHRSVKCMVFWPYAVHLELMGNSGMQIVI